MPVWLQAWIVIASVGLLTVAVLTALTITRNVRKMTDDITASLYQAKFVIEDSRRLVASAQEMVNTVQPAVQRFSDLGARTASVSSAVLEVLEPPLYSTLSVSRGVRAAATHFARRLFQRFTSSSTSDGGTGHV